MAEKPLAAIAIPLGLGIVAAAFLPVAALVFIATAALLALLVVRSNSARTVLAVALAAFAIGSARYGITREIPSEDIHHSIPVVVGFEGVIVSDPESRSESTRVVVRIGRIRTEHGWKPASGKLMATVYEPAAATLSLGYGDVVSVQGRVYAPFDPSNPGQFSWKEHLKRQGIYTCASIRSAGSVKIARHRRGNMLMRAALGIKRHIIASISRTHAPREASLVSGMLLGTYAYLPADVMRDFTRTGTLHLLAASGYNCFVLVFIASPILIRLRIVPKYRSPILIFLLILYLMMVGFKPSLVRATVMTSLYLVGRLLRRVPNTQNIFFAAAIVVLMANPTDLFDVGFQLSFLGVWALISIAPLIEKILRTGGWTHPGFEKNRSWWTRLAAKCCAVVAGIATATIAVSVLVTPVVAYYFNYISVVSLPANVALGLGVPVVVADGVAAGVVGWVPLLGDLLGLIGTWAARAMLMVVAGLSAPQWSTVSVPSLNATIIVGYYIVIYGLFDFVRSRNAA